MPYKCVHCSKIYEDGSNEVLNGCECRSKFFFYIKAEKIEAMKAQQGQEVPLSFEEKKQMEEEVREIAGIQNEEEPIFLDFESVSVVKPGKYLIDISKLFKQDKPRVYKLEEGKYVIDLRVPLGK